MIPAQPSLPELLARHADARPERTYLREVGGRTVCYRDAWDESLRWAGVMEKLGVRAGETVLTMQPTGVSAVTVWAGISAMRAWSVPINTDYRGRMLAYAINNSRARVLVVAGRFLNRFHEITDSLGGVETVVVVEADNVTTDLPVDVVGGPALLASASPDPPGEMPSSWDLMGIVYTSGTTGASKGVLVPWGQLHAHTLGFIPVDDLDETEVIYVPAPAYHLGGRSLLYLAALVGGQAVVRETFSTMEFWNDIREYGCTTAAAPGTVGRWLLQQPERPDDGDSPLRNVVMAPLDPAVDDFRRRFGVRVCTAFGMTEVSMPFRSNGWETPPDTQSCGRLRAGYPGYDVRLVDEHDLPVALGETGELAVRTSVPWTLNAGYFGMPDKTAEAWRNGWFHTGDAFRVDEDGWYYFVDRIKDCIRRRGENISSFEVEAGVNEHPAVLECAAVAVPADDAEDEVKVFVVRKPDQELTPEELVTFLVPRMPRFMIPRYIQFVDALPKTEASQRVQKNLLRQDAFNDDTWDRQAARMTLPK